MGGQLGQAGPSIPTLFQFRRQKTSLHDTASSVLNYFIAPLSAEDLPHYASKVPDHTLGGRLGQPHEAGPRVGAGPPQ